MIGEGAGYNQTAFFPIYYIHKTHVLIPPLFYYTHSEVLFSLHINMPGIPRILHITKSKKNQGADFLKHNQLGPP